MSDDIDEDGVVTGAEKYPDHERSGDSGTFSIPLPTRTPIAYISAEKFIVYTTERRPGFEYFTFTIILLRDVSTTKRINCKSFVLFSCFLSL